MLRRVLMHIRVPLVLLLVHLVHDRVLRGLQSRRHAHVAVFRDPREPRSTRQSVHYRNLMSALPSRRGRES